MINQFIAQVKWRRTFFFLSSVFFLVSTYSCLLAQSNYQYDENGRLIADLSEGITEIIWNNQNKIIKVVRADTSHLPDVEYYYDASGHRIGKLLKPRNGTGVLPEYTWRYLYYVYNVHGNVLATYRQHYEQIDVDLFKESIQVSEKNIYGAYREGYERSQDELVSRQFASSLDGNGQFTGVEEQELSGMVSHSANRLDYQGNKSYELINCQSSVLAVLSDRKWQQLPEGDYQGQGEAEVLSAVDYYPFGMTLPARTYGGVTYAYGFSGKERDNEIKGEGNSYNFEARMYDSRVARWLSIDPLQHDYPAQAPYSYALNSPIKFMDRDGRAVYDLEGRRVVLSRNSHGKFYINNPGDVPSGTLMLIDAFNQSKVGRETLAKIEASKGIMRMGFSDEIKIDEGQTLLGGAQVVTREGFIWDDDGVERGKVNNLFVFYATWLYRFEPETFKDQYTLHGEWNNVSMEELQKVNQFWHEGKKRFEQPMNIQYYIDKALTEEGDFKPYELYLIDYISYVEMKDFQSFLEVMAVHEGDHMLNTVTFHHNKNSEQSEPNAYRQEIKWLQEKRPGLVESVAGGFAAYEASKNAGKNSK